MNRTGWRRLAGVAVVGLVALGAWGALPEGAAQRTAPVKDGGLPHDLSRVPVKGTFLLSIRPADLWNSGLGKAMRGKMGKDEAAALGHIREQLGLAPADVERLTFVIRDPRAAAPLVFVAAAKKVDRKKVLAAAVPGAKTVDYNQKEMHVNRNQALTFLSDTAYAIGDKESIEAVLDAKPNIGSGGLASALPLATKKHSLVLAVNPSAFPKFDGDEVPAALEPYVPLLKAEIGTLTLDVAEKTTGSLRVAFGADADAKAGVKGVEAGMKQISEYIGLLVKQLGTNKEAAGQVALLKLLDGSLKATKVQQKGKEVAAALKLEMDSKTAGQVAVESVQRVRRAAQRMQSSNNLKQIGLALHSYHDVAEAMPAAAIYDKNGKALLSWRVAVLPYIEQDELYKEFKLDEAWDSAHNKKLLAKMPKIYMSPGAKTKNKFGTFYQAFVGKGAAFEGKTGIRLVDFSDGTSNTIMVAEAAADVPWTKPEDMAFDPDKALPKLGDQSSGGFQALFGDGSVRYIQLTIKKETLKALITRNGGEVFNLDNQGLPR